MYHDQIYHKGLCHSMLYYEKLYDMMLQHNFRKQTIHRCIYLQADSFKLQYHHRPRGGQTSYSRHEAGWVVLFNSRWPVGIHYYVGGIFSFFEYAI